MERKIRLLEQDDRGVFGPQGIEGLSAGMRKRYRTAMQPAQTRAFQMLRAGDLEGAEKILRESLPRNDADLQDERYFGIYCGLADVALKTDDRLAALDWFSRGIESFPSAVRKNHLLQLADMGIDVAQWIRSERDDGLSETDSSAILYRVHQAMAPLAGANKTTARAGNKVTSELGRLETSSGHVTRSSVKGYLS